MPFEHPDPDNPALPVEQDEEVYQLPSSFAQERLWILERLEPDSPRFNIPAAFHLRGPLAVAALARALAAVVARHESLRTHFRMVGEELYQVILSHPPPPLRHVDLRHLPARRARRTLQHLVHRDSRSPFDLTSGTLFRATLVTLDVDEHALLLNVHHSVADGVSMGILYRELEVLYETLERGGEPRLRPLPIQYADFATWQREHLRGEVLEEKIEDWRSRLDGAPELLEVPPDHPRPQGVASPGRSLKRPLPAVLSRRLAGFVADSGVTPFTVLLAAFLVLLEHHTGQEDLVVGTAIAGRAEEQVRGLVGYFVNALPIRVSLADDPAFRKLVARARDAILDSFDHQDVPFERLVEALAPDRRPGYLPLVQVVFLIDEQDSDGPLSLPGLDVEEIPVETGTTKYDLTLTASVAPERLEVTAVYRSDLYEDTTMGRFLESYEVLLAAALAAPETAVSGLPVLPPQRRHAMLREWNDTVVWGEVPWQEAAGDTLHRRVADTARRHPEAVAVSRGATRLRYAELVRRAGRVAHGLHRRGIALEDRVGVALPRSPDRVVALLGILGAGAAYVPLDPSLPRPRLALMLDRAEVGAVIVATGDGAADSAPPGDLPTGDRPVWALPELEAPAGPGDDGEMSLDGVPGASAGPNQLAYVLFTSGSSGTPKAVLIPHRGVLRMALGGMARFSAVGRAMLHLAPLTFDASTIELWTPLLNGGRMAVAPPGPLSLQALAATMDREGVTDAFLTTSLFQQMTEREPSALALDHLLTGGEVASPARMADLRRARPDTVLYNFYGPTENTVLTSSHRVRHVAGDRPVPIGRPVAGTCVYVVDRHLRPVAAGVSGELLTGGDGLARGYAGRPARTAAAFVPDPFGGPGERLYRTGDRVRWLADGRLDFQGRMDRQVKVRGFRIEPGEVEAALATAPGVGHTAVVLDRDDSGDPRLVAYVAVGGAGPPTAAELRGHLARRLPDYMVPSYFVLLDALPLTASGKVDHAALPAPERGRESAGGEYAAPRNDVETRLCEIWGQLLGVERVGIHDDFFALGGHSLLANRVVLRVKTAFGVELPLRHLFEAPTVAGFAEALLRRLDETGPASPGPEPIRPMDRSKRRIAAPKPAAGRRREDDDAV